MSNGLSRNQWGTTLPAQSQPHKGCFHKFSYHTLLPSPWIPSTARQAPTQPPGLCHSNPKRPQALSHWTQQTCPSQHKPRAALQHNCSVQPSMVSGKTLKSTQVFHSTLPGNMSAVSGSDLASSVSKLTILAPS